MKAEWEKKLEGMNNAATVQRLVDLLGIKQLTKGIAIDATSSPQGVHYSEPVDYFRRIGAEGMGVAEVRDQTVLQDIERWKADLDASVIHNLVAASKGRGQYALVWEHFSAKHSEAELMELTEHVVANVLDRDGASAEGDHIAIIALWRRCGKRLTTDQFTEWLQKLILSAMPVSLNLVNDLYYYWTGKYGLVSDFQRPRVRRSIVQAVCQRLRTGPDLLKIVAPEHPHAVRLLINQVGVDNSVPAYRAWRDHLASVLLDGARIDPELMVAQIANVACTEQSGHTYVGTAGPPVFVNPYEIDRERMMALFGESLDEALILLAEYAGDNVYAARARNAAESWLEERRTQETGD